MREGGKGGRQIRNSLVHSSRAQRVLHPHRSLPTMDKLCRHLPLLPSAKPPWPRGVPGSTQLNASS